jgi:hypothetical protein
MSYFDAEQIALDYLAAEGLGVPGVSLFKGPAQEPRKDGADRQALFVIAHDGPAHVRYIGTFRKAFKKPTVEIIIRTAPEAREAGRLKALAVLQAFEKDTTLPTVGCIVLESAPRYLERDRLQNHLWLVKIELWDVS